MLRSVDDSATFWTVFSMQPWGDPGCNWWRKQVACTDATTFDLCKDTTKISAYLDLCPSKWPRWQAFRMSTGCLSKATNRWCNHYDDHGTGSGTTSGSQVPRDAVKIWTQTSQRRLATWRQELALWTWHVAVWVMAVMATSSRGAPALCGTGWAPCGLPLTLRHYACWCRPLGIPGPKSLSAICSVWMCDWSGAKDVLALIWMVQPMGSKVSGWNGFSAS